MKYLFLALLFIVTPALADVYVVYNSDNVLSVSEQNDAIIPQGYSVKKVKGNISDIGLTRPVNLYKFDGNKFTPNATKIKADEDAQVAGQNAIKSAADAKVSATAKLKVLGFTDAEINMIVGK